MKIVLIVSVLVLSGCATIVNSDKSAVEFIGPQDGIAKVQTPDGTFDVRGSTSILVTRTRHDVPIEVTCNGSTQKGLLKTGFDWGWGGAGNLIFGGIPGWFIDGVGNRSYGPDSHYDVRGLCTSAPRAAASEKNN